MPKRTIKAGRNKAVGEVSSTKNAASSPSESRLEQDFLMLLEFDKSVAQYGVQPITIRWQDADGRHRQYTPDVAVIYARKIWNEEPLQPTTIFEVKPRDILVRDWHELRPKFRAAVSWCRANGLRFKLVTDRQIKTPYLENVRFLWRYRERPLLGFDEIGHRQHVTLRETLRTLASSTPKQLLEAIESDQRKRLELVPMIWQMIWLGVIDADLTVPLKMNTSIWLNPNRS